jgi:hypothetical protein
MDLPGMGYTRRVQWPLSPWNPESSLIMSNDFSRAVLLSGLRTRDTVLWPPDPNGSGLTFSQSLSVPIGLPPFL